jgi:periplasmic divalent cation tolerance protein
MKNVKAYEKLIIGYVSFPNLDSAKVLAKKLVMSRLVACAKVISNMDSFYIFEGKFQEDKESYLLMKTQENKVEEIKKVLDIDHPYKVYEFLYHEVKAGNSKYADWIHSALESIENFDIL